jgi:ATP-dependent DNA helicase RecG
MYEFIREFGEGVDRMYRELEEGGWPKPMFKQDDFMLRASLNAISASPDDPDDSNDPNLVQMDVTGQILSLIRSNPSVSRKELSERLGISERRVRDALRGMQDAGKLKREGSTRGFWIIVNKKADGNDV